jgi:hypothetical protein
LAAKTLAAKTLAAKPWQQKARATSPGLFVIHTGNDQAAGL